MLPTASQIIKQAKTTTFLVTDLINIRYLTGIEVSFGMVLITSDSINLFVDSRYSEEAEKYVFSDIKVCDLEKLENIFKKIKICGFESEHVTIDRLRKLKSKNKNTKFIQKKDIIQYFRRQKSDNELKNFRCSKRITKELLNRIPTLLKILPTEKDVAWKLKEWAHELKADELSFDPIVAFGTNTSCPHHHPTNRKLKLGHIVQIDVGVKYKGYCSDQSRVFFTSNPTSLQRKVYEVVKEAQNKAIREVSSGVTNHKLDRIVRDVLAQHNLEKYFTHSLGHGVGLEIHEGISLSQKAPKKKLLENEIITIEPGVYIPGKFGIRLEDEIIVPVDTKQ